MLWMGKASSFLTVMECQVPVFFSVNVKLKAPQVVVRGGAFHPSCHPIWRQVECPTLLETTLPEAIMASVHTWHVNFLIPQIPDQKCSLNCIIWYVWTVISDRKQETYFFLSKGMLYLFYTKVSGKFSYYMYYLLYSPHTGFLSSLLLL